MLELPYYAFIEPLEFAMHEFLIFAQSLTGSWGFSLVLLSLAVNTVLLPLYHLAEGWQEAERAMQKSMAPKLKEIKEVFRGRERYMYVRALYRLHGYKPVYALRAAFGLLIQIPFFFAAYHLLNNMPALAGVSWLCFADLSRPDALLTLGTFSINILPFVMTAANLISAAVYTARLTSKEKRNLLLLALVFLVLLYPSSAALLIYWTCNNIFSLGKNLVYVRFVYAATPDGKQNEKPQAVTGLQSRLDIVLAGLSVFMLAGSLIIHKHMNAGALSLATMAVALSLSLGAVWHGVGAVHAKSLNIPGPSRPVLTSLALVAGTLIAFCVFMLVNYSKLKTGTGMAFYLLFSLTCGAFAAWLILRCPFSTRFAEVGRRTLSAQSASSLYAASTLLLAALVFWQTPMSVYSSDPLFFFESQVALVGRQIFIALVFLVLNGLVFHWVRTDARPLLAIIWAWTALCALFFTFVAVGDYGHVDGMVLEKDWNLKSKLAYVIDPAVFTVSALLLWWALRRHSGRKLAMLLQGAALALIAVGAYQGILLVQDEKLASAEGEASDLPPYNDKLFGFSRHGKNTLILMTDMFTGSHLGKILENNPEFSGELDGFTWYRDNIGPGRDTTQSIAAILGGENYTVLAINARQPKVLLDETNKAMAVLPSIYGLRGYAVSLAGPYGMYEDVVTGYCPREAAENLLTVGGNFETDYAPYWRKKNGITPPAESRYGSFLSVMGAFRAAPWSLRNNIYGQGSWMRTRNAIVDNRSEHMYAMLDSLPEVSNAESLQNTVKYVAVNLTHSPWMLDSDCRVQPLIGEDTRTLEQHLISETCTLGAFFRWFDWMKREGVYDNTQIIIVSDHDETSGLAFHDGFDGFGVQDGRFRADTLLLVKQRHERGLLKIDDRLMSSSDVVSLICAADGPCPGIEYPNPLVDTNEVRTRTYIHAKSSNGFREKGGFVVKTIYEVTGPRADPKNWKITHVEE